MKELIEIQSELKAPKNQKNKFGNYNYRSCEDILEAVKPLLKKYKAELTLSDQVKEAAGIIYVEAKASFTVGENYTEVTAQAGIDPNRKGMDISQSFGSSSSYARKYALNGLFLIDDTKDHDTPEAKEEEDERAEDNKPWLNKDHQDFETIKKAIKSGARTMNQLRDKFKVSKEIEVLLNK